jgi:integrase/recombinase XerD
MAETGLMPAAVVVPADRDQGVIDLWLHGRPLSTQRVYRSETVRLLAHTGKGLGQTTLGDLQAYADSLAELKPATRARRLATVKSLFKFAHELGLLPVDVGRPLRIPKCPNHLSERIMPEAALHRMLALERNQRNHCLLRVLYASGCRVSELCGLRWRHLAARAKGGQISVHGKGGKDRAVLLPKGVWEALLDLRGPAYARQYPGPDSPVFVSRQGSPLSARQVVRIVKRAAERAGLPSTVSPHWLRHAHASHALERGASIALVKETLGHSSIATTGRYLHVRPEDSSSEYLAV